MHGMHAGRHSQDPRTPGVTNDRRCNKLGLSFSPVWFGSNYCSLADAGDDDVDDI